MASPCVLVADVGSSSLRVLLFDTKGEPVPGCRSERRYSFSNEGTIDAQTLRHALESCLDETLKKCDGKPIIAFGMATFAGNLLAVDERNQPLTPLYTYADTRSQAHVPALMEHVSEPTIHHLTGCRLHSAYHPARWCWLRAKTPQIFHQAHAWLDFATYCYRTWFRDDVPMSYSLASWSGVMNRFNLTWEQSYLDLLGISPRQLPTLADYHRTQTGLAGTYRERWRALADLPFYLGIGDGAGANIGSIVDREDTPVLTIGTTGAIRIISPDAVDLPMGLWSYRVDARRHLVGGATTEGGNIFRWARQTLQLPSGDLDAMLSELVPARHNLTVLPLLGGERSPNYHASAKGTIHGITLSTTPLQILQALFEAVALRLHLILDSLPPTSHTSILAGGGALHASSAWVQILADVFQRPIHPVTQTEPTARGVALLITEHLGFERPTGTHAKPVLPRPEYAEIYAQLRQKQKLLYDSFYANP